MIPAHSQGSETYTELFKASLGEPNSGCLEQEIGFFNMHCRNFLTQQFGGIPLQDQVWHHCVPQPLPDSICSSVLSFLSNYIF